MSTQSFNPCTFDQLKKRSGPPLNAWGLHGQDNELGRLNMITPESIKRGRDAIKHGIAVNLNVNLNTFPSLHPVRPKVKHEVIHRVHCLDDTVSFNTQCATQWDGFRHFSYKHYPKKDVYTFHGGMTTEEAMDVSNKSFGIQLYADNPITSRAHLLDIPRYLAKTGGEPLKIFERTTPISLSTLKACAEDEGVTLASGDILIVRTGFTEALYDLNEEGLAAMLAAAKGWVGVEQTEEVMRWHWDNGIAAVATDTLAYEVYPPLGPLSCHEVFLAGWGLPIGELFDLRKLAAECERLNKWTFMFTSMVLNLDGGIGSPPNAQAIL